MLSIYLLGFVVTFIVIKFVNKLSRTDECFEIYKLTGWLMFILVLGGWYGLLAYFVYLILASSTAAKDCPNKNKFYIFLNKLNKIMEKIFS